MDQVIWIEILTRSRDVTARLRFTGPEVRVGRGYDNDVVIDDPYVAPRHLRVFRDEQGQLVAEDLGSVNGLYLDRDSRRRERISIDPERPLRVGHTLVRVRGADYAVQTERVAGPQTQVSGLVLTVALAAAVLGITLMLLWLGETDEPRASRYLTPVLSRGLLLAGWVGAWAVLARVFCGSAHFRRNLVIALSGLLALALYTELVRFTSFALTWRVVLTYGYVGTWCILALMCFYHLREIGPTRLKLNGGIVAALLAVTIGLQTLWQSETFRDSGQQSFAIRLMPPALRLAPIRAENDFFADVAHLKTRVDRDRLDALLRDAER
jgi:FHA domain-containing protein